MTKARWSALCVVLTAMAVIAPSWVLKATPTITISPFSTNGSYPTAVGIDWLSGANRLLVSWNYNTGEPSNFAMVNRTTKEVTPFGSQHGWTNEIYFAVVRPGTPSQTNGWPVDHVFSANTDNRDCIAEFDGTGTLLNACFAHLDGGAEMRLKRGGVTFDHAGVLPNDSAGKPGDLLVAASIDIPGIPSALYRVNRFGVATKMFIADRHIEGILTVPEGARYGPWAGQVLVGEEFNDSVEAIPPTCVVPNPCASTQTLLQYNDATGTHGVGVEDLLVIPYNQSFYITAFIDSNIMKADAAQFNDHVGQILLISEAGQLFTAEWDGGTLLLNKVVDIPGENFEHAVFVEDPQTVPAGPVFVVGDVEPHALNDAVNFWGAQWWKNNAMSGFVSNGVASFKGYADQSTNACGGTWTSRPGNSSNPPATIPQHVTIIVTNTVVKIGNDISGNIKQILTVAQDGGYGPAPGHRGNGPVISVVTCP